MTQFMSGFVAAPALGGGFVQPVISGFVQPVQIYFPKFSIFFSSPIFFSYIKGAREADTDMFGVFVGDLPQDANEQDLIKLFTVTKKHKQNDFQSKKTQSISLLKFLRLPAYQWSNVK